MRTLLVHPERLQSRTSLVEVRVDSDLTIHSEDSANADVIDLVSVSNYYTFKIVAWEPILNVIFGLFSIFRCNYKF